jgi:predicted DNA binding CopG/RHH family protein
MKCETVRSLISSYIDKDLNDVEKIELEKHLAECEQCREEYECMLDIIAVCSNLEELELPQSFRIELQQKLAEEKKKKHFFGGILGNKGMKMATGLVAAVLVIAIGIGSPLLLMNKNVKMSEGIASSPGYGGAIAPVAPAMEFDGNSAMEESKGKAYGAPAADAGVARNSVGIEFNESLLADQVVPSETEEISRSGRMVIRTGNISASVESVDKAALDIRLMTESSGGYIENSQIENISVPQIEYTDGISTTKEYTEKYANITIRVPEAEFQNIFNNIKGMGKLVSENISGNDITAEYRDTEARVDNLKIQEQSLKQLMTKANNVDEILRIETELNRVRTDIDINSGNLKRWDNLVQLSTIYIYMRELKPEELKSVDVPGMWEKAYQGFIKAINNVVGGLENTVILLVAAIPYLVIAGLVVVIGLYIARKIRKKKI